jgi:sulfite reductase alpha subunit-like flavoprotein
MDEPTIFGTPPLPREDLREYQRDFLHDIGNPRPGEPPVVYVPNPVSAVNRFLTNTGLRALGAGFDAFTGVVRDITVSLEITGEQARAFYDAWTAGEP